MNISYFINWQIWDTFIALTETFCFCTDESTFSKQPTDANTRQKSSDWMITLLLWVVEGACPHTVVVGSAVQWPPDSVRGFGYSNEYPSRGASLTWSCALVEVWGGGWPCCCCGRAESWRWELRAGVRGQELAEGHYLLSVASLHFQRHQSDLRTRAAGNSVASCSVE